MSIARPAGGFLSVALTVTLAACGSPEIPVAAIRGERILSAEPATLRDGGKLVSGTVVNKTHDGRLLGSIQYRDGFPNGQIKEWYPHPVHFAVPGPVFIDLATKPSNDQ